MLLDKRVLDAMGAKVLSGWLDNQRQLRLSLALDIAKLSPHQAALLAQAMASAAHGDGGLKPAERDRLFAVWETLALGADASTTLAAAIDAPFTLNELVDEVNDVQTAALVYAGSLLAMDRRIKVHRYYLRYLAARLNLSEDLISSLHVRFPA